MVKWINECNDRQREAGKGEGWMEIEMMDGGVDE